ncbi:phosphotransferase [Pseudoalteromonas rubra]|uniref:phosphotransferase n=1 Tax=Pseudoalteromonas rubra TaxID=43658 RepID=UPI0013DE1B88|nr:phosphotransferase [Pseudoalteromonas rubra]
MPRFDAELSALIRQAFPALSISALRPLNKGLSNKNYYLEQAQQGYLLKHYSGTMPVQALEAQGQLALLGVAQPLAGYHVQTRLALFEFLPQQDEPLCLSDSLLANLHTLHGFVRPQSGQLDLSAALCEAALVLEGKFDVSALGRRRAQFEPDICFCHNDLVKDNMLVTAQGPVFIDFEYAQYNDRYFDLAALCVSFSLSVREGNQMLKRYFSLAEIPLPEYAEDKLHCYVEIYLLLCLAWYQRRGLVSYVDPLLLLLKAWCR